MNQDRSWDAMVPDNNIDGNKHGGDASDAAASGDPY